LPKTLPAFASKIAWFLIGFCVIAGVIWRWTPFHQRWGSHQLMHLAQSLDGHPWTPLAIMGIFMAGGLVLFVHAILLWTTVFVFDPWHALLYCELGTLASGCLTYGLGRIIRPELAQRIAGSYFEKVSHRLGHKGKQTLIIMHWFPICPFSILNFVAGATQVSFIDFLIGTLVGCTPGLLIISFYGGALRQWAHGQHWLDVFPLILAGTLLITLFWFFQRRFKYGNSTQP